MGGTFSDHWYRVAGLHPRLRAHVRVLRHCYRGEVWHVLVDAAGGRRHRLNRVAYAFVARLDGRLSVQQVWDLLVDELGDDAPSQPELIALLTQLHEGELIQTESAPDIDALFDRRAERRGRERRGRLNPLALRVPLFDPTPLLTALAPLAALLLKRGALVAWLAMVVAALVGAGMHARELAAYAAMHLASPGLLLALWLAYPLVKMLHELAHALAVKVWGGEVHELGLSLLVLMPLPYVDASEAAALRERHRRVMVSLIGIVAETALAALALLVWTQVADGAVRHAAFAVLLIGGVSTLLFNGNPLMRFDAYYALADAIESPGLAARARAWWLWLARRRLLGVDEAPPPAAGRGERRWLLGYGAASAIYRWVVMGWIVGWLLGVQLWLGLAAAAWYAWELVLRPLHALWRYLVSSPELVGRRPRAVAASALALALPLAMLLGLPLPAATVADGVVWLPEQALVRSDGEGFVQTVWVRDGEQVGAGQPLLTLHDPVLLAELQRVESRLRGLDVAYHAAVFGQLQQIEAVAQELARVRAEHDRLQQRLQALTLRAGAGGRLVLPQAQNLEGLFLTRGSVVAHVLAPEQVRVRVLVTQDDVARLDGAGGPVAVWLADEGGGALPAQRQGQTPAALRELPSPALAQHAGGPFATDPADTAGLRVLEPLYAVDLSLPGQPLRRIGARVRARFEHGREPLATQAVRRLRQLLIGKLGGAARAAAS